MQRVLSKSCKVPARSRRRRWLTAGREMTRQHFGIVLVIIGTVLLAFAVNVRSSRERIDPSAARVTQFTSSGAASSRRRRQSATIRPWLQWGGLGLLALGSALQW